MQQRAAAVGGAWVVAAATWPRLAKLGRYPRRQPIFMGDLSCSVQAITYLDQNCKVFMLRCGMMSGRAGAGSAAVCD